MPGREDFWNIGYPLFGALTYTVFVIAVAAVTWGIYRRFRIWRLGAANPDLGPWEARIRRSLQLVGVDVIGHRRFVKGELYPGLMHFLIFWGFLFLLIATSVSMVEFWFHKVMPFDFPTTRFRVQEDFVWDVFGGLFLFAGLVMALFRRYVLRPARLNTFIDDQVILWALLALVISGFLVEGLRIAGTDPSPAWATPVGYLFYLPFKNASDQTISNAHEVLYWTHVVTFAAALAYLGLHFSKISHIFFSPLNAFLRPDRAPGALRPMGDLMALERFGAGDITDFTWKQLLDFDACTNCGRCQDQCPAHASGKVLSPRKVIQDLRLYGTERAPVLIEARKAETEPASPEPDVIALVDEEALWSCTTCMACVQACPVFIGHIDSIVDMRRNLVMEQSRMPETAQNALLSMEQRGHPWRGTTFSRTDWAEGLDVPTMADHPEAEVLFWVGCTAALEQRSQSIARAMVVVLKRAGVDFAILGAEETCTGDPARRMGNEYLFQVMATQNIETFARYNVKKIVTISPHCFNTLKNEYPQLGGDYDVVHYAEFVAQLIDEGKIKPVATLETAVAYHDSCYLGRHNGVYDPPRRIAEAIPGVRLVEMEQRRERSFCCGAGGGHMWIEETGGERVNHVRTDQFLETDAETVCVSCPFCLQMFEEGISAKGLEGKKEARDLLEVLADSLGDE